MNVAVVTDSTAYLPGDLAARHHVRLVPLHVVVGGTSYEEGRDISSADVAQALRAFRPVSTSRPSPGAFLQVYEELAHAGAQHIVSVHISGAMSATASSAEIAAEESPVPVTVVDSRSIGMAMGYAVLAAAEVAASGAPPEAVAQVAHDHAAAASVGFYVDTLEYLRRGGRIGKAAALFGSALAIKPLLTMNDGQIEPLERVRTTGKALARMRERAVEAAAAMDSPDGVDIAVHHLDSRARAEQLVEDLAEAVPQARRVLLVELGAVVGAHVGPGTLATAVSPRLGARSAILGASA
ncbi:DegV family protein [Allobranchiibius sp. CTAmp26]|uniref:DegV family protein n=1 Tax=Allobranchiibius sp. CTAmp26 TaxID=2815214 RepID=UPI001AA121B5|nr:DegV family protein [Allobranchiibius sp. CTAmp26]MBO1755186.1 DegV family protein [Allobranchiibius sp. CTAmp26]